MSDTSLNDMLDHDLSLASATESMPRAAGPGHVDLELPGSSEPLATPGSYAEERRAALDAFERSYVKAVLGCTGGNVSAAARIAKIDRVYLHRLMRRHHTTRASLADFSE